MNRDRLLADAKARALSLCEGYVPPEPPVVALPGPSGEAAILNILESEALAGRATAHDLVVGKALATVLTGGPSADPLRPLSEDEIIALERQAFISLFAEPATIARVQHMLATGKPLRN